MPNRTASLPDQQGGNGRDVLGRRPSPPARALMSAVRLYQAARHGRPSPCRFFPSCSSYSLEAVERHGAARGCWLTVHRLARCRPWGGSGFDPVPD